MIDNSVHYSHICRIDQSKAMTLDRLEIGRSAVISRVGGEGALRQHLLDMGVIPGQQVFMHKHAPLGDPVEIIINGYSLSLRLADAALIELEEISQQAECLAAATSPDGKDILLSLYEDEHPGLGEGGRYHDKSADSHKSGKETLRLALAGNPNCGKTTLFNRLTGSNQHVGNFPGVTVDRKDGEIRGFHGTKLTDLPGIYSLSPYSAEEIVSRNFILEEHPDAIINIVDASNIERNLYLTMQLMELDVPIVLALNMMDEVRGNGGTIRVNEMEKALGLPVVAISASKGEGVEELMQHAVHIASYSEKPARQDFCAPDEYGGAVHRCLHSIMHLVEDHALRAGLPLRFAASKLIEGDTEVLEALKLSQNEKETLEHIISQMEEERGMDRSAAIADMRYSFIRKLCAQTVVKPQESREYRRSRSIDRVLTGRWTAIPIFVAVISLVIWLSIDVLGAPLQDMLESGILSLSAKLDSLMLGWQVPAAVRSLVVDGIFGGVGTVVSFIPIIIILFFFLSMLEDSGYMARVAFVSDKLLRKIGLSGRSIVPLLIGFGCSVPAIMATRTLPSARDRKMTILLTPFMSCSAKIPIYAFLSSTFFPGHGGLVLVCLYLGSILVGVTVALCAKSSGRDKGAAPFVMELPNYRMPGLKNVARLLWDKSKDFLQRAFTLIFVASIVIWFLQSFDFALRQVAAEDSMLARIAGLIAPLFAPLGLGDWRIVTALISGFLAKESVVSTLQVLGVNAALDPLTAIPMLVFCLLYTPCIAAVAAVRRELGGRWAAIVVVFQCLLAWLLAFVAYLIAGLL